MRLDRISQNSWQQIWSLSEIPTGGADKYIRCVCPILLSKPIVACLLSFQPFNSDSWEKVGYVSIECRSGLVVGGNSDSRLGKRQIMYANKLQIFAFDLFAFDSSLIFDASLTGNVQLFAWEYTGAIN